jgi:multicomponent Na+:H+ antiporter subunit C
MTLAIAAGLLAAVGAWLVLRGGAIRLILGFILLGHAANLVIISAGVTNRRSAPITGAGLDPTTAADPLPQAFVLTAIVITFGVTVYLLSLVSRGEEAEGVRAGTAAEAIRTPGEADEVSP